MYWQWTCNLNVGDDKDTDIETKKCTGYIHEIGNEYLISHEHEIETATKQCTDYEHAYEMNMKLNTNVTDDEHAYNWNWTL